MVPAPKPTVHRMTLLGAHQIVAGALKGEPAKTKIILGVLGQHDAGSPAGAENASILDTAKKLQVRAQFVGKWRGPAAAQRILFPPGS